MNIMWKIKNNRSTAVIYHNIQLFCKTEKAKYVGASLLKSYKITQKLSVISIETKIIFNQHAYEVILLVTQVFIIFDPPPSNLYNTP